MLLEDEGFWHAPLELVLEQSGELDVAAADWRFTNDPRPGSRFSTSPANSLAFVAGMARASLAWRWLAWWACCKRRAIFR